MASARAALLADLATSRRASLDLAALLGASSLQLERLPGSVGPTDESQAGLGAASAGYPLSLLVKRCGWPIFFQTLALTSGVAFALLSTIGDAKSFSQREAAGEE